MNKQFYVVVTSETKYDTKDEALAAAKRIVADKNVTVYSGLSYVAYPPSTSKVAYVATVTDKVETPLPEAVVTTLAA